MLKHVFCKNNNVLILCNILSFYYKKICSPNFFLDDWLVIFSLIKNTKEIISLKEDPNDIKSVHGIRFVNAMLLVFAHKIMAELFKPFANRTEMSEVIKKCI